MNDQTILVNYDFHIKSSSIHQSYYKELKTIFEKAVDIENFISQ